MGSVKFYKSNTFDEQDKSRTPVSSGMSFSRLIAGKTIDEMGWYGDEHDISQAHIRFNDGSYLVIGWNKDYTCPAATFVTFKKSNKH